MFTPFNPKAPVRIYKTNLPHWRQAGCTYFVTFRLADSIPAHILNGWEHEKMLWLKARNIAWDSQGLWVNAFLKLPEDQRKAFERAFERKVNRYLDEGHGSCVLKDPACADEVSRSFFHFDETRYELGDFVIMPNHVHLLIRPFKDHELENVIGDIKSFTAKKVNRLRKRTGMLWQKHSYDHIVRDEDELHAYRAYIAGNPKKANLKPGEFLLRRT